MKLSPLQKHILLSCYGEKGKFNRAKLLKFYDRKGRRPKQKDQINIVTKSLERLIEKGYLVGYGVRTPKKWFIREIKLTIVGRRVAKGLLGKQVQLPFK